MTKEPSRPLVICVDDDSRIVDVVARCLKHEPVEVRTTLSPVEALAWVGAEPVAVLVSDYEMPEMTGAQLAGRVKHLRPETTRILLTGKRTFETVVDGINQGEIFRFIAKPFAPQELRDAIAAAVARNAELVALSSDRQRRERRDALRDALEAEYPGITDVVRASEDRYIVPEAASELARALGFDR